MKRYLLAFVALLYALVPALAQTATTGWLNTGTIQLAVTNTSAAVAAPGSGQVFYIQNVGANTAYVTFGNAAATAVAASTSTVTAATPILAGQCAIFSPINATYIAAITASSTTTLDISQGTGFPACGGASGSGGGGGGGAVTVADGADVAEGTTTDSACATDNGTCTEVALIKRTNQRLTTVNTTLGSPLQAGGNIGNVSGTVSLPTGASTSALQTTGNTSLATIATNSAAAVPTAQSGGVTALISCDNHVFKHITSATDTLAVQGVTAKTIYICGWRSRAAGVATWMLENTASTNANCSSTLTQINGLATEAANTGENRANAFWDGLKNTAGNGLCINSTGTGGVDVDIWYAQF